MQFNTYTFAVFFVAVLALDRVLQNWTARKSHLLVASYLFYAAWDPVFVVLLWISTLVDWKAAAWIAGAATKRRRRALMALSVIVNLGFLGYFKYGAFLAGNLTDLTSALGLDLSFAKPDIVLPIGISFYTFHSLSYTIDVYLERTQPCPRFLDFALYVTFFPQLVAGPILRASQFLPQLELPRRATSRMIAWGCALLVFGIFEKQVLADTVFGPTADEVFWNAHTVGCLDAWTGTLAFAGQIFCDFAGYSLCAIGAALCLGFVVPDNFRSPYAARGFSDFWLRWHISLSSWLRDYLYIPLGGNRRGPARTYVNLMLTMLLGGLWHGAAWTFVAWGALHGLFLVGERRLQPPPIALTFVLVCLAWVPFRATSFGDAFAIFGALFGGGGAALDLPVDRSALWIAIACVVGVQVALRERTLEAVVTRIPWPARACALALAIVAIALSQGEDRAFIYFQF